MSTRKKQEQQHLIFFNMNPLFLTDGYKTGHHQQYPKGTTLVYSNFTPRSNKYAPAGCDQVVSFGQSLISSLF